jgi:hypothetical protein
MRYTLAAFVTCILSVAATHAQALRLAADSGQSPESPSNARSSHTAPMSLAPAAANLAKPLPQVPTNLPKFDPRNVELRRVDNHWQLAAGRTVLKDFGSKETEARTVLRLVRELGLTQLGTIGEPRPIMEYWLTDGHAPNGLVNGVQLMTIDTASLRVEHAADDWLLVDRQRVYFNFGTHENEADTALAVIRHYGFSRVGYVGQGPRVMNLFLGSPTLFHATEDNHEDKKKVSQPGTQDARFAAKASPDPQAPHRTDGIGAIQTAGLLNQAPPGDRTLFDWRRVTVKHEKEEWKVMAGSHQLASFEGNERDARLAQSAIQQYRLTEHFTIGQPVPGLSYFLSNGQPPRSLMFGLEQAEIKLNDVKAKHDPNGWIVTDGRQLHLHFANEADAKAAEAIFHRYKFDHILHIGPSDGNGLTFYARTK